MSAATSRDRRDTEDMLMEKTKRRLFFPSGRMAAWDREQGTRSLQVLSQALHRQEGRRQAEGLMATLALHSYREPPFLATGGNRRSPGSSK